MWNIAAKRAVSLALVLSTCFMTGSLWATEDIPDANDEYLSVRESLIPMFAKASRSKAYSDRQFPLNRLNPKIREYIRFYIEEDNTIPLHSCMGIWLLGFVGTEEDLSLVERYIDKAFVTSGRHDGRTTVTTDLPTCVGCFAGMMTKRSIKGAGAFLNKYAKVSAWMVPDGEEARENLHRARKHYSYYIMFAYQYSLSDHIYSLLLEKSPGTRPYPHESSVDALRKLRVDKYTELMTQKALPPLKLNENIQTCLDRYGEYIDMLLRKQTLAQWHEAHDGQKAASRPYTSVTS